MNYSDYMQIAIDLANEGLAKGEVPVGAIIVKDGVIIGKSHNEKEQYHDALAHAEMIAIRRAAAEIGNWRLSGATMFVTLEPCPMCAGAILQSRIDTLVFGAWDLKWGACGSIVDILNPKLFNHHVEVISGIMEKESKNLMTAFFKHLR